MERESFENEEIGKMLSDNFVPIKVDREERPDVDKVYVRHILCPHYMACGSNDTCCYLSPTLMPTYRSIDCKREWSDRQK